MATKDLKFIQNFYKAKDDRGETYYLQVKAIDSDGSEIILLDHVNNKSATGAQTLKNIINSVKNDYDKLIVSEFRAFSPGRAGSTEAVQVHEISLKENKPVVHEGSDFLNVFGGLQGFIGFTRQQARIEGENQAFTSRLDELKNQNGQLLSKLGSYESEIKKLENEIRRKEDHTRELKWQYEDRIRDMQNEQDKELRKYKGQSAIINAGVQGLGSLLMKKLNVSGDDLAGLLGLEVPSNNQPENNQPVNVQAVHVEPDNINPEIKQKADMINAWLLRTDTNTMDKVYSIFDNISKSEQNLNEIFELIQPENNEVQY